MHSKNGAKSVVVQMDNLSELANLPASVLGHTDVPFYKKPDADAKGDFVGIVWLM